MRKKEKSFSETEMENALGENVCSSCFDCVFNLTCVRYMSLHVMGEFNEWRQRPRQPEEEAAIVAVVEARIYYFRQL